MKQYFIGSRGVANVVDTGRKTPMGGIMLKVNFEDGSYEYMPEKRFDIIKTEAASDVNYVKGILCTHVTRDVGSAVYSMMLEFGCKLSEIDSITNQVIVMTNSGAEKASNLLWGIDYADERTLNKINDILLENVSKNPNGGESKGTEPAPADSK